MSPIWKESYQEKLILPEHLEKRVRELRQTGKSIGTLNGAFDLLHAGHLHVIYEASKQGDLFILALNSDRSIQAYKDPNRPLIPLEERLEMVAALEFVDYITYFEEEDPRALLEKIRPDVHTNGSEYGADCIEADVVKNHGGRLHIVTLIPGLSTTQIIEKIQRVPCV